MRVLQIGFLDAGIHRTTWDETDAQGHSLATGVYITQLHTGLRSQIRKMLLLR